MHIIPAAPQETAIGRITAQAKSQQDPHLTNMLDMNINRIIVQRQSWAKSMRPYSKKS
jgi:hypothetical protein